MQIYIVTGGWDGSSMASTETFLKNGGTSWQSAASLPSARHSPRGIGLDNGKFILIGQCYQFEL